MSATSTKIISIEDYRPKSSNFTIFDEKTGSYDYELQLEKILEKIDLISSPTESSKPELKLKKDILDCENKETLFAIFKSNVANIFSKKFLYRLEEMEDLREQNDDTHQYLQQNP